MKIESLFNRLRRRALMLVGFEAMYQASKVFYFASESRLRQRELCAFIDIEYLTKRPIIAILVRDKHVNV